MPTEQTIGPDVLARGLTEAEAARRLASEGYNELPQANRRTALRIALEAGREPMFQLLIAAGLVYLVLGDLAEALVLLASAMVTVAISVYQENRTERVLETLRDLTSPRAAVIRDGMRRRIPGREVARGDLVVVTEGDRIPADGVLCESNDLLIDESLLTGEAVPVRKRSGSPDISDLRPGGDDLPFVYSGTIAVRGQGLAVIRATGPATEIGKIGRSLTEIETVPTRLNAQTRRVVRIFAIIGLGVSALVALLYGLLREAWLEGLLAGITLAMSMLPEEIPLVLTVFLVMGAWRMSRQRVLTRRAATIEALGAATVLCTDKTGTLTLNQMSVAALQIGDDCRRPDETLSDEFRALIRYGILASERDPFDPMEKAFHDLGARCLAPEWDDRDWILVHEYGLSPGLLAMTHVWNTGTSDTHVVAAKGAPEAIGMLCRLDTARMDAIRGASDRMAADGMRVLAVARAEHVGTTWPASPRDFSFTYLGLVALADPLRPTVPEAIRQCRSAGIRVVMITGDYPATAQAIARQAGIEVAKAVVTGDALARMNDTQLRACVTHATVFARVMPEQKLRLVQALKANGEIVGMTGDGVNDAPSLKAADIGIAMGGRGTDVAREASAIVLLDDDFGSIVNAIRLGRRIFDNLLKALGYIFAVHVPIAGLALLPVLAGWPPIFMPVHIAFLELVIDPVCSVVFEAEREEADTMDRPPREPDAPLFSPSLIGWSLFQGACVLAVLAAMYAEALGQGLPHAEARSMTFVTLVLSNFSLILANRSFSASPFAALRRPNPALWRVCAVAIGLLAIVLYVPGPRDIFKFVPLTPAEIGVCMATAAGLLFVLEAIKLAARRYASG